MFLKERDFISLALAIPLSLAISAIAPTRIAFSQDQSTQQAIEEIIVTATKRSLSLDRVPISIGVLTASQLDAANLNRQADYWRFVPSMAVREGPFGGNSVIVRGLSDSDAFDQNESLIAFYIDDTAITQPGGLFATAAEPYLVDMARVEVLRGPHGVITGANSMGGAVRVVTNEPDPNSRSGSVSANLQSTKYGDPSYGAEFVFNQPITEGRSAVRFAAIYQEDGGWIDDIGLGTKDINDDVTVGARLSFTTKFGENFDFLVRLYGESRETGGYNYQDPDGQPGIPITPTKPHQRILLSPEPREDEFQLASARLTGNFSWGEFVSVTSWYDRATKIDLDWSPEANLFFGILRPAPFATRITQEDISQEFRFSSKETGSFRWLAGAYFLDQENTERSLGTIPGITEDCPGCYPFILPDDVIGRIDDFGERQEFSIFGEVTFNFLEDFDLTIGGRWYELERTLETSGIFAGQPLDDNVSGEGSDFVPKASVAWQRDDGPFVYLLASQGYRAGLLNETSAIVVCDAPATVKPDTVWNYELGVRAVGDDRRWALNTTAFYLDWSDMQAAIFDPSCTFPFKDNAGSAMSYGLEFDATYAFSNGAVLGGTFGYNEAELIDGITGVAPPGTRIPNVPRVTGTLFGTIPFAMPGRFDGHLRADYQYVGERRSKFDASVEVTLGSPLYLPSYSLLNLRFAATRDRWLHEIFVENALDEKAVQYCCRVYTETTVNRPRTFGYRMRVGF